MFEMKQHNIENDKQSVHRTISLLKVILTSRNSTLVATYQIESSLPILQRHEDTSSVIIHKHAI